MNKKVFATMLSLSVIFLILCYFLKIFFPQEFVMAVENETIVKISLFIDSHKVIYWLFAGITAFITYWLYCCACTHRLYLKWYECLEILAIIIIVRVVSFYDINISTAISVCSFIFLPALMKGDIKTCAIVYTIHGINQCLTLTIRDVILYMQNMSTLVITILSIDMYIWLITFYILFNFKQKEN